MNGTTNQLIPLKHVPAVSTLAIALALAIGYTAHAADPVAPPAATVPSSQQPSPILSAPALPESDLVNKPEVPLAIRTSLVRAEQIRADYLAKKSGLLKEMRRSDAQTREEVRAKLRENRQAFFEAQRENRADLRKAMEELRAKLTEHKELFDTSKSESNGRKGSE